MNVRDFLIPSGAIGLSLLSGCTPAVVGDWELTGATIGGVDVDLDYTAYGYEFTTSATMSVDKDLTGEFDIILAINGATYSEAYGDVIAEKIDARTFDVEFDDSLGGVSTFECSTDKDTMSCDGRADDGTSELFDWEQI